jgi:hypothetical protein
MRKNHACELNALVLTRRPKQMAQQPQQQVPKMNNASKMYVTSIVQ